MTQDWTRKDVLDLARSFQPACVLAAAADWDVFTPLASASMTASAMASALGADVRAMTAMLDALVAMELLSKQGDEYSVPANVTEILTNAGRETVLPMVQHQANCLRRWAQLSSVVLTGRPAKCPPSVRGGCADRAAFINAMHTITEPMAEQLVAEIQPAPFRHLLDIGGASGTWTIAFLQNRPHATATILDLPEVVPMAQKRIREMGLSDHVTLVSGDYTTDELPGGADFVWLSAIAHQNSRQQNRELFQKIHRVLPDGGRLMIRDIIMNSTHTQPPNGALFAINMLVSTQGGGTYAYDEYREDLERAGFVKPTLIREDPWMDSVIQAKKP